MQDLTSGTQLANRYTLIRKLARGGLAETWLAKDRLTGASVALKVLADERLDVETLRREWQLSIRLMHAHIVRVFEFHDDDHVAFYSLQYIDGPDLGVLSGAPLFEILAPVALVADALRYAHGKDVVHRDIKAANVLLDHNGAPYLIDFGIASIAADTPVGGSLIAATPAQLDGETAVAADDVFALGGLIYELVSGRSPYSAANTADDIRNKIPAPLTAADGTPVPEAVTALVAAMLDKDPARRPSAEGVVDALKAAGVTPGPAPLRLTAGAAAAAEELIESETELRPTAVGKPAPAAAPLPAERDGGLNPRTVGISLAVLIVLLLGVVFLLPKTVTTDQTPTVADEPEATGEPAATDVTGDAEAPVPERDERVQEREDTEETLGRLLAKTRTLESRAVQRWGGLAWKQVTDAYAAGDEAYLARDYALAQEKYREAIERVDPLLEQVDQVFETTVADAELALESGETADALRLYELAVAISPSHGPSKAGLARARNLDTVLSLTEQGLVLERNLELDAARQSFEEALDLDPQWQPAREALVRVQETDRQLSFDLRMTEGLTALAESDFLAARAAFRRAQELIPGSPEPADGLLQVDQGLRLQNITLLEGRAGNLEQAEQWQEAAEAYASVLEQDANLQFAQEGLRRSQQRIELHKQLEEWIDDPDSLSSPRTMQAATNTVVDVTRMGDIGPRLAGQRDELSRLLKRAATPLRVRIVSDNATDVSIYKVGKLGAFGSTELELRPGTYVAVGSRPGFRDVRLEFRVAPEIDMQPIVVRCEERI